MAVKTYTYSDTTQLTPHFKAGEFRCKCGKSHDTLISDELLQKLETLRDTLDCSKIIVNSGYRCASHDKSVGGTGSGQHTKGTAADVVCYGQDGQPISSKMVCCTAQDLGFGGIANITSAYTSTYLDVRTGSRWYGDEVYGTNTVTSDFYSYFGIAKASGATARNPSVKAKGIDVSKHQGVIDWDKVKASGKVDFAMIRVGVGSDIASQDDAQAVRNMTECERVGLPYGVYLYSYALSTADAESEAEHVLRMISGRNPVLGVWLDMEDADGYKERHGKPLNAANGSLYTQICRTFCNRIAGAGVYASKSVLVDILSVSDLPIWVAQWASKCTYSGAYDLWQYSNAGKVDGISVDVDLDYLYKDIPQEQPDATDSGSDNSAEKSTGENLDTLELILEHVASIDEKMK